MRRISLTVVALLALPLQSCCSLARLFCGPDKSEWVSVSFETPELTVRTFLEALRRDDPSVIYKCLSDPFRAELGVDQATMKLIWPQVRDQYPGLHLAGYATVPTAVFDDKGTAIINLDVEGQAMQLQLIRQCHWEVRYRRPGARADIAIARVGGKVANPAAVLQVTPISDDPPTSIVALNGRRVAHSGFDELAIENIEAIGLEQTWRITSLGARQQ